MTPPLQISPLTPKDVAAFQELVRLFELVFDMDPYERSTPEQLEKLLQQAGFLVVVARLGDQIVGGLTVYTLDQYYAAKPLAYIYDLAVLPDFQRQGVGKQLIQFIQTYCKERGFEEVFVQADRVDAHALDFYRATRPTAEEEVLHFYYRLT